MLPSPLAQLGGKPVGPGSAVTYAFQKVEYASKPPGFWGASLAAQNVMDISFFYESICDIEVGVAALWKVVLL